MYPEFWEVFMVGTLANILMKVIPESTAGPSMLHAEGFLTFKLMRLLNSRHMQRFCEIV